MPALDSIDLLRILHEQLDGKFGTAPDRADISVAGDLAQVVEMLASAPAGLRLVISDEGDEPANADQPEAGIIKLTVALYVAMAAGLPAKAKAGAWLGKPGKPALLAKCGAVRDFVRSLELPEDLTNERFEYTGRQPVIDRDGGPLHAYRLSFQIYTALPEPDNQPVAI